MEHLGGLEAEGLNPVEDALARTEQDGRDVSMAQIALAWVLRNPLVSAPIVGATKPHHLTEAVATLDFHLTDDEAAALEESYVEYGPSWF